jgi:hypothetical protein
VVRVEDIVHDPKIEDENKVLIKYNVSINAVIKVWIID